jgi:hypothetical protein
MTAVKISVSLDESDLQWVRRQAKKQSRSVSAVLTEAVRRTRRERALDEVLKHLDAKVSPRQLERLRRQWDEG